MNSLKKKSLRGRLLVFVLVLLTVAVSCLVYQTTRKNPSDTGLASYTLRLQVKSLADNNYYSFTHSCLPSGNGASCRPAGHRMTVFPRLFQYVNLTSDDAAPGSYRGIRVQVRGKRGTAFYVKSARLQNELVFDGGDESLFRNAQGMRIFRDRSNGLIVFQFTSDSASFEVVRDFNAKAREGTLRYTGALLAAVLFFSAVMLLSVFGRSGRGLCAGAEKEKRLAPGNSRVSEDGRISSQLIEKYNVFSMTGGRTGCGVRSAVLRMSLAAILFYLLFLIFTVCWQLLFSNDLTVSSESCDAGSFLAEVSGSPDFSSTEGRSGFYNAKDTLIKIPSRFRSVRIFRSEGGPAGSGFSVSSSSGSCRLNGGVLEQEGDISCSTDTDGRVTVSFGSRGDIAAEAVLALLAAIAAMALVYSAFRFLKFSTAVRLMLTAIMISAYITGEVCLNIEAGTAVFYRSYLSLLPDVAMRNICLMLLIFLITELSFSTGFICSGTFLQILLLTVIYIAVDWGVSLTFGMRSDIGTMLGHQGADNSTAMVFVKTFFRNSLAAWMAAVMLADWAVMALSFRLHESHSLKKYLLLIVILNCIPFLKVYGNLWSDSSLLIRKDIFDIQGTYPAGKKDVYTAAFPLYDWKPESKTVDGLNRRKNVVILFVESFASAYSHYFSGLKGYTPEFDRLSAENAAFLSYHSTGVETAPATYSLLTGKIFFPEVDRESKNLRFEYSDALPNDMKAAGYSTAVIYSSQDFAGLDDIYRNSGFASLYGTNDPAYQGARRFAFNSVADGILLSHAADLIHGFDRAGRPHLTMIMTASSHNPFQNPETGKYGMSEVMPYVDREIGKFVDRLEKDGFFEHGTLVITGDHHPPLIWFEAGELEKYGEDLNRVPLLIVDRDIGKRTFTNVFGHDSLRAIIEYLNLPEVKKYDYQLIPFWQPDSTRSVTVLLPVLFQKEYLGGIKVTGPGGETGVYDARGDKSEFASHFLTPEQEKEVAGRVKWFKREE